MSATLRQQAKRLIKQLVLPPATALGQWQRRQALSVQLPHVTRASLARDLEALAFPPGVLLLVHTSLKGLGFVEGGAGAVVDALIDVVVERRGGTLALPSFSIDGNMHKTLAGGRPFDVRATPSNLGAIPEAFRRRPGVRRSIHPTHSIAALGAQAAWVVEAHHRCGSNFGRDSPMARLMEAGGMLAGLGTDLGTVTFYHCLEDLEPDFPVPVYGPDRFAVTCTDWDGAMHRVTLPAHAPAAAATRIDGPENTVIRSFFTDRLVANAGLKRFAIGQGRGWVVPLQAMYAECQRLMQQGITIYSTAERLPPS